MRMRRKRWPASSSLSVQDHLPTRDTVSTTGWRGRMSRRHPIQRLTITTSSPPQPLGFHHHTTDPFLLTHTHYPHHSHTGRGDNDTTATSLLRENPHKLGNASQQKWNILAKYSAPQNAANANIFPVTMATPKYDMRMESAAGVCRHVRLQGGSNILQGCQVGPTLSMTLVHYRDCLV